MVLSAPWYESLVVISLQPVKQIIGICPMVCSAPLSDSLNIIDLNPVNKNF